MTENNFVSIDHAKFTETVASLDALHGRLVRAGEQSTAVASTLAVEATGGPAVDTDTTAGAIGAAYASTMAAIAAAVNDAAGTVPGIAEQLRGVTDRLREFQANEAGTDSSAASAVTDS